MSGNTFGRLFRLTTYGESHGPALGGVVDGWPAASPSRRNCSRRNSTGGVPAGGTAGPRARSRTLSGCCPAFLKARPRERPSASKSRTPTSAPAITGPLAAVWRPGHADMTYDAKYGVRDFRGGGRSSARETAARVAGGAIARALLAAQGISVRSCTLEIGGMPAPAFTPEDMAGAASRPYCAPCEAAVEPWEALVRTVRGEGDTLGGIVRVEVLGVPPVWANPCSISWMPCWHRRS